MRTVMLKIDPYTQTVVEVDFSDSLTELCQHVHARRLTLCPLHDGTLDSLLVDAEVADGELIAPAWVVNETGNQFFGTGLLLYVSEEGQYRAPLLTRHDLLAMIEFIGFVQPEVTVDFADLDFRMDDEPDE